MKYMSEWENMSDEMLIERYKALMWLVEMKTIELKELESRLGNLRLYCLDKELDLPTVEEVLKLNG